MRLGNESTLRLLIVDDSVENAEAVVSALRNGGLAVRPHRPRDADEKARLAAAVEQTVWPWIAAGRVRPRIDKVFPLPEAAAAHAHLEAGDHLGKVMLTAR